MLQVRHVFTAAFYFQTTNQAESIMKCRSTASAVEMSSLCATMNVSENAPSEAFVMCMGGQTGQNLENEILGLEMAPEVSNSRHAV